MRLDKYLKLSRLIKRRTVAKEAASGEYVLVNDLIKKPSYLLKVNDVITIKFKTKILKVKVTTINPPKQGELMYELISETNI